MKWLKMHLDMGWVSHWEIIYSWRAHKRLHKAEKNVRNYRIFQIYKYEPDMLRVKLISSNEALSRLEICITVTVYAFINMLLEIKLPSVRGYR